MEVRRLEHPIPRRLERGGDSSLHDLLAYGPIYLRGVNIADDNPGDVVEENRSGDDHERSKRVISRHNKYLDVRDDDDQSEHHLSCRPEPLALSIPRNEALFER